MKSKIRIVEVGPRDGLQNEQIAIPTSQKVSFVEKLFKSGLNEVELTSFVRSDKIPQLADAKELTQEIARMGLLDKCWVLIPNAKGAEIALSLGISKFAFFSSASEKFNQKNINCSTDESLLRIKEALRVLEGSKSQLRGYLSMVFGCPYEGDVDIHKSFLLSKELFNLGINEISLGDTIGVAGPRKVKELLSLFSQNFPMESIAMHFHDTKGMGLVNIYESIMCGVTSFDSSAAGLGGCPFAKGATGNIATEDVVHLLNMLELNSGVNLEELTKASFEILNFLKKDSLSKVHQFIKKRITQKNE